MNRRMNPSRRRRSLGDAAQQMYTLAELQSANGSECYLQGPDGNQYTPAEYAAAFYGTTLPELNPCAGIVAAPPPAATVPTVSTAVTTPQAPPPAATPADQVPAGVIYRLILAEPDGTFATGANYKGCSQSQTTLCDPQTFPTLQAAVQYAADGNEIPVLVSSEGQAWDIIAGNTVPSPAQILPLPPPTAGSPAAVPSTAAGVSSLFSSPLTLGLMAVGAYFYFRRK